MEQPYVSLSHMAAGTSSVMFTASFFCLQRLQTSLHGRLLHPTSRILGHKWIFKIK